MSLKSKTISGLLWSFVGSFTNQIVTFFVGIILARLLSPAEYGLIAMTTTFIVFSQTFVDSGFGQALIRKNNCTQNDYSTVFYFNLIVGLTIFLILFSFAGIISDFFNEPQLKNIIRVLGLDLIFSSFTIIQKTILTKQIDFKLQTKVSFVSTVISGLVGVFMAFNGFGVWSLVAKTLVATISTSSLLWMLSRWRPDFVFSKVSFKELFGFGSKMLISNLIDRIYWNIYYVVIGKFFTAKTLGFYSRAEMFKNLPSQNITFLISGVAYPALSQLQDNNEILKEKFRILVRSTMYISFFTIIFMIVAGKELILILIGEKWIQSVGYLRLLCFGALFFPLIVLNTLLLKIKGKSNWYLKTQIITKFCSIPIIILGILYGIEVLIIGTIIQQLLEFLLISIWVNKLINYNFKSQLADILPSATIITIAGICVYIFTLLSSYSLFLTFSLQIIIFLVTTIMMSILLNLEEYLFLKVLIVDFLKKTRMVKNN